MINNHNNSNNNNNKWGRRNEGEWTSRCQNQSAIKQVRPFFNDEVNMVLLLSIRYF